MKTKVMFKDKIFDATIEMVDGVMVVTPKETIADYSQFKDGDIITCGWNENGSGSEWVCVLRGEIDECVNLFIEDYCALDLKSNNGKLELTTTSGFSDGATYVRYATEEEKQKLFDALAKEGKMWDAEKKAVVDLKWKPQMGEKYYFSICHSTDGFISTTDNWGDFQFDKARYKKGWVFPYTDEGKAKCQALCDKLNEAINSVKP